MDGKNRTSMEEFFKHAEEEWGYRGHEKDGRILEKVEEYEQQGIRVPIAAILACEKYECPLNAGSVVREFSVKPKQMAEARRKLGIKVKTDYSEMIAQTIYNKGLVTDQEATREEIQELIQTRYYKGLPRTKAVRAGYDYLLGQGMKINQKEYCGIFKITDVTLRNVVKK